MRRKKDAELHKIEEEKIKEKKEERDKGDDKSKYLEKEAIKIETKVQFMQKFEGFLEKVRDMHSDEFGELTDILSRYQTLITSNKRLKKKKEELDRDVDYYTNKI